jgi:hypothetical protein
MSTHDDFQTSIWIPSTLVFERNCLPMFSWRPAASAQQLSLARFVSDVRLQTDFGPGYPPGQPQEQKKPLYVVEPAGKKGTFQRFLRMTRGTRRRSSPRPWRASQCTHTL